MSFSLRDPILTMLLGDNRTAHGNDDANLQFGYPMAPGDTVGNFAANLRIPVEDLVLSNPGLTPDTPLTTGLVLTLPPRYIGQITSQPNPFVTPVTATVAQVAPDPSALPLFGQNSGMTANIPSTNGLNAAASDNPLTAALNLGQSLGLPSDNPNLLDLITDITTQVVPPSFAAVAAAPTDFLDAANLLTSYTPLLASPQNLSIDRSYLVPPTPAEISEPPINSVAAPAMGITASMGQAQSLPSVASGSDESTLTASLVQVTNPTTRMQPATVGANILPTVEEAFTPNPVNAIGSTLRATQVQVQVQTQVPRGGGMPPPPPIPGSDSRVSPFANQTPLQSSWIQQPSVSSWNAVASVVGATGGTQAKLEIMALLTAQLGQAAAASGQSGASHAAAPGFIDPQAAAYAASVRTGRAVDLGMGRTMQFSLVDDRLNRVSAIGEEASANGLRRTGDGLDQAPVTPAEPDEETQDGHESDSKERRRLAAIAAMRRRRRPLSTRCRYRRGIRRPLRETGRGRYPQGVDLAEFSQRLPPRYLWTVPPRHAGKDPV